MRDYAKVIAALLANADNEGNTEEARQAYRNKAESLMREYRVAEEDALATDPGSVSPVVKTMAPFYSSGLVGHYLPQVLITIADHCEVQVRFEYVYTSEGRQHVPTVVGYEGDVRYFEFLWTSAHLMFSTRINPRWEDTRTEADNIFYLRNAGVERREIADRAWGMGSGLEAKNRSKVQRIYLAEAKRRGEEPVATGLGFNRRQYQEAYADGFISTLHMRLWKTRQAANAAGGAITLAGRTERVQEAFYAAFPQARPSTTVATPYVAPNANCERCAKATSGYCREHNWLKPRTVTQADRNRWDREENSTSARAGRSSGRTAAEGVVIQRRSAETGKMGPSTTRELS